MTLELQMTDARYSIIKPVIAPAREDSLWLTDSFEDLLEFLEDSPKEDFLAIDFETTGTEFQLPDFRVVTIGISNSLGSLAVDTRDWSEETLQKSLEILASYKLIAHNIPFDGAVFHRLVPFEKVNWQFCTYGLLKQLASEGFPGQRYSLKDAQINLIGWTSSNEKGVDEWLIKNGFFLPKRNGLDTPEQRIAEYETRDKKGSRKIRPDKAEMWRVPHEILGYYCALDADSTWLLFMKVLFPALLRVPPQLKWFHQGPFLASIGEYIRWAHKGVPVDSSLLQDCLGSIVEEQKELEAKFREAPGIKERIAYWEERVKAEAIGEEPPKFKKQKTRQEPDKLTKSGEISKNWLKWKSLEEQEPEISGRWLQWVQKKERVETELKFNPDSSKQLGWLFYGDALGDSYVQYEVTREHLDKDNPGRIRLEGCDFDIDMTESGDLPTDKKLLGLLGEVGSLLSRRGALKKLETSYYLKAIEEAREDRIYGKMNIPGTNTGRWAGSGGKLGFLTLPKDKRFLECFKASPGFKIIQADVASLEPHVLAELSRDRTYMKLYGPNAKENCVYLFIGSHLPGWKEKLAEVGYDPDNPTPEGIKAAKTKYGKEREVWKIVHLSAAYSAGPYSIYIGLRMKGTEVSFKEIEKLHQLYWSPSLFGGVKKFEEQLKKEWVELKGWYLDALGCPVTLSEKRTKDFTNACIQRSGHSILTVFITELAKNFRASGIEFNWIVPDLHDETIYEVREDQVDSALQIHAETVDWLNEWLGGVTKLKMDPQVIESLAGRKD